MGGRFKGVLMEDLEGDDGPTRRGKPGQKPGITRNPIKISPHELRQEQKTIERETKDTIKAKSNRDKTHCLPGSLVNH